MAKREKIEWVSTLKVLTMILVIIGHSGFLTYMTDYGGIYYLPYNAHKSMVYNLFSWLVSFIYTFHMPIFMSISGMLFSLTLKSGYKNAEIIKGKCKRLIIPFVVVTLLYNTPIMIFSGYMDNTNSLAADIILGELLLLGNNHLWYVLSLFWIFLLSIIIEKNGLRNNNLLFWIFLILLSCAGYYLEILSFNILGIATTFRYLIYFYLGYNFFNRLNNIKVKNPINSLFCVMGMLLIFILRTHIKNTPPSLGLIVSIITAVILGGLYILCVKGIVSYFTKKSFSIYNYMEKNTYELYLYSCPINYIILYFANIYWGDLIFSDNLISLYVIIIRIVLQILISFILIEIIKRTKIKNCINYFLG